MIEPAKVWPTATVFIKPIFSLAETAEKLGTVLGGVTFTAREYHDVPAYDACALGFHFILFDIPDPEMEGMEPEEVPTAFLFTVIPELCKPKGYQDVDIADFIAQTIEANSDLQCRVSQEEGL